MALQLSSLVEHSNVFALGCDLHASTISFTLIFICDLHASTISFTLIFIHSLSYDMTPIV